jgi:predicted protein tyrosine phosphatase
MNEYDIEIYSESGAIKKIENGITYDCIISIYDLDTNFEDIETRTKIKKILCKACEQLVRLEFRESDISHIQNISKIISNNNYKKILIYCDDGHTKSPSIAIVLLKCLDTVSNKKEVIEYVMQIVPWAKPNKKMLSCI